MKRILVWTAPVGVVLLLSGFLYPSVGRSEEETVESMLVKILAGQQQMQAEIRELKERLEDHDRQIAGLRSLILQRKDTSGIPTEKPEAPIVEPAALQAAKEQYQKARALEHDAIFNVRKGEQTPWFKRVNAEYQIIVDRYPQTPEAPKAQLRIAHVLWRYLGDIPQAKDAFQKTIDRYPGTSEAQEARNDLKQLP